MAKYNKNFIMMKHTYYNSELSVSRKDKQQRKYFLKKRKWYQQVRDTCKYNYRNRITLLRIYNSLDFMVHRREYLGFTRRKGGIRLALVLLEIISGSECDYWIFRNPGNATNADNQHLR
jgi:hypothetical protein